MRLYPSFVPLALGLVASSLVACGGSAEDANPAGGGGGLPSEDAGVSQDAAAEAVPEAAPEAAPEAGDPLDPNYPAPHTPLPQVDYNGGRILTAPKIVTITWQGDPLESRLQQFGDVITTTPWWDAVTAEYCVAGKCIGHGTNGGHVVLPGTPAASYTDTQIPGGNSTIQELIKARVADGTFPVPDADTLYVLYFTDGVSITLDAGSQGAAQSCTNGGFGGYHQGMQVTPPGATKAVPVAYAILPRCGVDESTTTVSASHEIVEAATDPATGAPAYYMTSSPWAVLGGEVGDLCVDPAAHDDTVQESTFTVQRSWSNASAAASHDPCVPIPAGNVYFNAAPQVDQLSMAVGDTQTIEVDAFSDAAMTGDWTLSVIDFSQFQGGPKSLTLAIDQTKVHNGSKLNLTVTLDASPAQGQAGFALVSKSGTAQHFWPVVVSAQ